MVELDSHRACRDGCPVSDAHVLRRRPVVVAAAVLVLALLAWVAFGWFGVQQLVLDDKVDEEAPTFASTPKGSVATAPDAAEAQSEPSTLAGGDFRSRSHPTRGTATVLSDGADARVLRLENFETDNGPDLNVYLSTASADAPAGTLNDDYIDLGDLKGNVGAQNYDVPPGVDLDKYRTVVVWCVRFLVAFGTAALS